MPKIPSKIIVHNGTFHADDVLCVAMMQILNPDIVVARMEVQRLPHNNTEDTIIADLGGGKYDHHQENALLRPDGRKYAACGILLRTFSHLMFPGGIPREMQEHIRNLEDYDNKYPDAAEDFLSQYVRLCNPDWNESHTEKFAYWLFLKTVETIREHYLKPYQKSETLSNLEIQYFQDLTRELLLKHQKAEKEAQTMIMEAFHRSNGKVVVLPERLPWYQFLIPTSTLFVINPSNRGGYHLQCVPEFPGTNHFKQLLPGKWQAALPAGCSFVHSHLFIAAFDSAENALVAVESIL